MSDLTGPQPSPIPEPDRHQLERLNSLYAIIDGPVAQGGLRSRIASVARRLLGRVLSRQQEFNAVLVDHINRNMVVGLEARDASIRTIEWIGTAVTRCEAATDEVRRYEEALRARDRREDAAVPALAASHAELRAAVGVLHQAAQNLKREIGRLSEGGTAAGGVATLQATAAAPVNQFDTLDSHKYVGFEDQFRGSPDDIRRRVMDYLPIFQEASEVIDVGCGRGEFLGLLREHRITARGVDVNPAMVDVCREQGLDAATGDALTYLRSQPDGSLGGLFAAQVVEHLEPRYLTQLLDAAFDKLRPGAPIVLETINPACWFAFFESYIRDLTHVRPVHPDTLRYLVIASGFQEVVVRYRAPYPESDKLQRLPTDASDAIDWVETLNENVEKINRLLFTYMDYAAIGKRA